MTIDKELLALGDVAEVLGTSSSNVSNLRKRDAKFPIPYEELASGPVWKADDIAAYANMKYQFDIVAAGNLKRKRVAIVGRARGGKTFLISRFVKRKKEFVNLACGNSSDKTACVMKALISDDFDMEIFEFHSSFNSVFKDIETDEVSQLKSRIKELSNRAFQIFDLEAMSEIEKIIRCAKKIETNFPELKDVDYNIQIMLKPNEFGKNILRESGISVLELIDTPGVSGSVKASNIEKSDLYIFIIKPDNMEEAQTLKHIVTELKAEIATSKVAFLFKKEGYFMTKKKYEEARSSVKENMKPFSELFADMRNDNIIYTTLDLLNPAENCILYPTMDEEEVVFAEEMFLEEIKEKILSAFNDDENSPDKELEALYKDKGEDVKELALKIMSEIPKHEIGIKNEVYTISNFESERHDRVKTNDNNRIVQDLQKAYKLEHNLVHEYFSTFRYDVYQDTWQHKTIQLLYKKLTDSVKMDRGLGIGCHQFEDYPPTTMLVEESIVADRVYDNTINVDASIRNDCYRKALQSANITSATWNFVACRKDDDESMMKLKIIKESLLSKAVNNRIEMVLCRYVGGLRRVAQYRILLLLGYSENDAIIELQKLPF